MANRIYHDLYGIQTGKIEDYMGWTYPLDVFVKE